MVAKTPFRVPILTLMVSGLFASPTWADVQIQEKKDLGDNSGASFISALSADGRVAGGYTGHNPNTRRAIIWSGTNYEMKQDLGTLKLDNSGWANVLALSADGRIAVGNAKLGNTEFEDHAVVWSGINYQDKKDLGTLRSSNDQLGWSNAYAVSADGRIVGGNAINDSNDIHATVWSGTDYQDKKDLGTLQSDNAGHSIVYALNADGKIAGGASSFDKLNDTYEHAVIWSGTDYQNKKDLGTLRSSDDQLGWSMVYALSADGTIAGGRADNDDYIRRAVIWSGDNYQTKTDLGTLKKDNSGSSSVRALSADGRIAGGNALSDSNDIHAVIWSGDNYQTKTDLGTLKSDNSGTSSVHALSADGTIAGGQATDDNGTRRATLWKIAYPTTTNPPSTQPTNPPITQPTQPTTPTTPTVTPPTTATPVNPQPTPVVAPVAPVVVAKIDVDNSRQSIQQLGRDTVNMLAQQRDSLQHLHDSCHHGQGTWCYRLEQRFAKNQGNKENSLGLSLGYGISPNLTLGVNYQHGFSRDLPNSFQENGNQQGMGVFARYQQNGWFVEPSLAWNRYRGEIQRPMLSNTESAKHKTRVQGKSVRLTVGQLWQDDDHQQAFSWYTALRHDDVRRPAYQENVEGFPVNYGQARFKETTTAVGMQFQQPLTEQLSWQTRAEVEQRLRGDEPTYTAQADYIGNFQERIKVNRTRASLQTGLRYAFSPSMNVEVAPYVKRGAVGSKTDWGTSLRLQGQF